MVPIIIAAAIILVGYYVVSNSQDGVMDQNADEKYEAIGGGLANEDEVIIKEEGSSVSKDNLSGEWISVDDEKYEMTINSDGSYRDVYDGDVVDGGSWEVLTSLNEEELDINPEFENSLYLKKTPELGDPLYYNIAKASESELIITYLFGDVLRFRRK